MTEERAFIENWWQRKFSMPNLPTGDDVIMFAHALELLKAFRGAGDAKRMTGPTGKSFLEAWWLRKFPANPLKWGSVLSLADAEELLMEFRISTEATLSPDEEHYEMVSSPEEKTSCENILLKDVKPAPTKPPRPDGQRRKRSSYEV